MTDRQITAWEVFQRHKNGEPAVDVALDMWTRLRQAVVANDNPKSRDREWARDLHFSQEVCALCLRHTPAICDICPARCNSIMGGVRKVVYDYIYGHADVSVLLGSIDEMISLLGNGGDNNNNFQEL